MDSLNDWAKQVSIDRPLPVATSDWEIAEYASAGEPVIKLESGNIFRTLGGRENTNEHSSAENTMCEIDLGIVCFQGQEVLFASHCSIRRSYFSTKGVLVMNSQFYKNRNLSVRGHPSDGKLEMITSRLSIRQYLLATKKSESGSHLPHPDIDTKSAATHTISNERELRIYCDGRLAGCGKDVTIGVDRRSIKVVI